MKKLFLALLIAGMGTSLQAQGSFEGTIEFNIAIEGENADQMAGFMPESYIYKIKGPKVKFSMNGGMMAAMMGDFVFDSQSKEGYMIQHSSSTAYRLNSEEMEADAAAENITPEVQATDETATIAGYACKKYIVTVSTPQGATTQEVWATTDIDVPRPESQGVSGGFGQVFIDGLEGFPLKVVTEIPMMGKMIMEAGSVTEEAINNDEFAVPAAYKVEDFDPSQFGMGKF